MAGSYRPCLRRVRNVLRCGMMSMVLLMLIVIMLELVAVECSNG